jgi:hypothetical protein
MEVQMALPACRFTIGLFTDRLTQLTLAALFEPTALVALTIVGCTALIYRRRAAGISLTVVFLPPHAGDSQADAFPTQRSSFHSGFTWRG